MKKQIYYYPNGNIAVVEGSPEIRLGTQLPIKIIEIDMDDEVFNEWQSNPIKHRQKFKEIAEDVISLKKKQGTVYNANKKIKFYINDLQSLDTTSKIAGDE